MYRCGPWCGALKMNRITMGVTGTGTPHFRTRLKQFAKCFLCVNGFVVDGYNPEHARFDRDWQPRPIVNQ